MEANNYSNRTIAGLNTRTVMYGLLLLGGLLIAMIAARFGFVAGMVFAAVPLVAFVGFTVMANPYWGLMIVFTVNYFILGLTRYIPDMPGGVVMDVLLGLTLLGVFIQTCYRKQNWSLAANGLTVVSSIWMLYCFLEIFNLENSSVEAWFTSIRGVAFYFFIMSILTPVLFGHYRDLKRVLYMWSVFTLIAVLKAWIQKTYGFDGYELRWLYMRGESTHLIRSGVRYFSIYTDAANYGAGMGFAMVVFSICAIVTKKLGPKLYFLAVAFFAAYGMMISGTRGAIAVPFAGYALYILLSKNWKVIITFSIALVAAYFFLNHTKYLHGNAYVRRMRSAFNTEDLSFIARLENQRKMAVYLKDRPFGVGIGMSGGKAKRFAPYAYMSQLPTDSWYVMLWAETGIVGLILYLGILFYLLVRGSYIIMFKIKDRTLRGVLGALLSGIFGVMVCSYGNEILGQFPTGFIVYTGLAFVFLGPHFDKQIAEENARKAIGDGTASV